MSPRSLARELRRRLGWPSDLDRRARLLGQEARVLGRDLDRDLRMHRRNGAGDLWLLSWLTGAGF